MQDMETWTSIKPLLAESFKRREKPIALMEQGILLLEVIQSKTANIAPVNYSERIAYIKQNASNYTAFRQLEELFKETEKKIARQIILQNKDK